MKYKFVYDVNEVMEIGNCLVRELDVNYKMKYFRFQDSSKMGSLGCTMKKTDQCVITQWDCLFHNDVTIYENIATPVFAMHFMLNGTPLFSNSGDKSIVKENSHNIWSLNPLQSNYTNFRSNDYCSSFGVILEDSFIDHVLQDVPSSLKCIYHKYKDGQSGAFFNQNTIISSEIRMLIAQIKHGFLMGDSEADYIEEKVKMLLDLQVIPFVTNSEFCPCCLKQHDVDKLYEAREIIQHRFDVPPSISILSKGNYSGSIIV
ncbi:hypothetical protein K5X82_03960 [Halosquirtibacter xylanolyticus]|uniref:hypothetical protein n=1 Tax=Halosquirtibacter xylanolyticus TaxID=3374599 RepID=UPI0037490DA2|nr:hypothetical protein K5X82_03960 [Prolixibacteraceae bacterium]